ncbi:LptF/LptG family permease [Alloacidobacterium sp.]|uniref:LptF/LptG family permease n=1 Tax=Alloacidobacterium sp. TaxID=2951999 RepID=UPI002D64633B|nr:LptF/LptG family permease [Alloacidobacterium sp.]HYK34647.1 LptF/LptG family permease [Alloacidobacterium sp.]
MRILTRYILREVLTHGLLGGVLFTFVLFMKELGPLLELAVRNSTSSSTVGEIFLLMLPNMFTVTIPMAVLVGTLLGLSRLAADSEITAMRASGVGVWRFVGIVGVLAAIAWGAGLVNTLYFAPKASAQMLRLEDELKNTQATYEIQPRVFYEDLKNVVLYVEDVRAGTGAARWRQVFLADLTDPVSPKVTTAEEATVASTDNQTLTMRLQNGMQHQIASDRPDQYTISTFAQTDLPLEATSTPDPHLGHSDAPVLAMSNHELVERARRPGGRWYQIELERRYAYPTACLVLLLVGVPLGISSKRGGKGAGFVLTIVLVFVYYFLSSAGVALARQNKLPVLAGVWMANLLFGISGIFFLRQMSMGGAALAAVVSAGSWFRWRKPSTSSGAVAAAERAISKRHVRGRFPLILDEYVIRQFLSVLTMVLAAFVMLMLVFTFFELLGDIIRNQTPFIIVGEYLLNLTPSMIYIITPLSVLIAVLVVFGGLNRTNELTAMKATGTSLYRIVVPILVIASVLSLSLFLFDEAYLPAANRKQEALHNVIKGRPAQTYLRPDRKWMFGMPQAGQPGRIFYYEFFDPDNDRFANITVFEFDPATFSLSRRIFAAGAHWDPQIHRWIFEHGWQRSFNGDEVTNFHTFEVSTFPEIVEQPQYFKKETRPSQEMSFNELQRYIRDLRQSGLDTMRLRVQLNRKLAYPVITLVMAILAIPFALSMGKRGSLTGVGIAIGMAIAYMFVDGMFEAMGNVNMLPAFLAAWSPDVLFALAGSYLLLRTPT